MSKPINEMTTAGRIRSLRMALRKADHPKVDEYSGTYLLYVTSKSDTIEEAVTVLFEIDAGRN